MLKLELVKLHLILNAYETLEKVSSTWLVCKCIKKYQTLMKID